MLRRLSPRRGARSSPTATICGESGPAGPGRRGGPLTRPGLSTYPGRVSSSVIEDAPGSSSMVKSRCVFADARRHPTYRDKLLFRPSAGRAEPTGADRLPRESRAFDPGPLFRSRAARPDPGHRLRPRPGIRPGPPGTVPRPSLEVRSPLRSRRSAFVTHRKMSIISDIFRCCLTRTLPWVKLIAVMIARIIRNQQEIGPRRTWPIVPGRSQGSRCSPDVPRGRGPPDSRQRLRPPIRPAIID